MNPIMRFFSSAHLPDSIAWASSAVEDLAEIMDRDLPDCAEKSAGLRKAKDCFVRAALPTE